jgi:hypothetical protein
MSAYLLSCNRVAASHMQIVPEWPSVACKLYLSGRQSHANCTRVAASPMQIFVDFMHVACDCRPRGYNLHATGSHSGTIYMRLATSRMQILHELAASTV